MADNDIRTVKSTNDMPQM